MKKIFIFAIRGYQKVLSPILDSFLIAAFGFHFKCRYSPTCSQYTLLQVRNHGTISGLILGMKRIGTCVGYRK